jgi:hypothetical protein
MADPLSILSASAAGIGALGSLFGGGQTGTSTTTQTIDRSNPFFIDSLNRLTDFSQQGFDPEILANLRASTRERFGNQASALRLASIARQRRSGVSAAAIEQNTNALSTGIARETSAALSDIDFQNEQAKLGALGTLGQLASQLTETRTGSVTSPIDTQSGFAGLFGSGVQGLLFQQQFGNLDLSIPGIGVGDIDQDVSGIA